MTRLANVFIGIFLLGGAASWTFRGDPATAAACFALACFVAIERRRDPPR